MKYIAKNLQEDEEIKKSAQFSLLFALPWLSFFIIFLIVGILLTVVAHSPLYAVLFSICGTFPFLVAILDIKKQELVVTNKRILGKRGIFGVKTIDILFNKVESVSVTAGPIGRLMGFYRIEISGSGTTKFIFIGVKNAEELKNTIVALS